MVKHRLHGDLEIELNPSAERVDERAQRVAWTLFIIILLAALAGAFGSGPWSDATVSAPNGSLTIEHPRSARFDAPFQLNLTATPAGAGVDQVEIWLGREYLDSMDVERIVPVPATSTVGADRLGLTFATTGGSPARVSFTLRPRQIGMANARVGRVGDDGVSFRQFIFP